MLHMELPHGPSTDYKQQKHTSSKTRMLRAVFNLEWAKQPHCLLEDGWIKKYGTYHSGISFNHKSEYGPDVCSDMVETWKYWAK